MFHCKNKYIIRIKKTIKELKPNIETVKLNKTKYFYLCDYHFPDSTKQLFIPCPLSIVKGNLNLQSLTMKLASNDYYPFDLLNVEQLHIKNAHHLIDDALLNMPDFDLLYLEDVDLLTEKAVDYLSKDGFYLHTNIKKLKSI